MRLSSPKKTAQWISVRRRQARENRATILKQQVEANKNQAEWALVTRALKKLLRTYPEFTTENTYSQLVFAYRKLGNYLEAKKVATVGTRKYPQSLTLHIELAEALMGLEEWQIATTQWKAILLKFPDTIPAGLCVRLAVSLRHQKQYQAAEKYLDKVSPSQIGKDTLEMMRAEYAELSMIQGDHKTALTRWQKLLEEFKKNPYIQPTSRLIRARFYGSVLSRMLQISSYKRTVIDYKVAKRKGERKIAIFTAIAAGYDSLKLPERLDARFDYILFTDETKDVTDIFETRPLPYRSKDKTREARYVKTHAHELLSAYDVAVWVDANIMITDNLYPLIEAFMKSGKAIAGIPHPQRKSVYEEAEACLERGKDKGSAIRKQVRRYKKEGFDGTGLIESNVMMFRPQKPQAVAVLELWWQQINLFSKRDQLSLPYALYKTGVRWYPLATFPNSARNHPSFILVPHDINSSLLTKLAIMIAKHTT